MEAAVKSQVEGKLVKLAKDRQRRDLKTGKARGLAFDSAEADRIVSVVSSFRHSQGEWAGELFRPAPWQEHDILRPLFGWKRANGTRRFRIAYIEIARNNGKSTIAATIGHVLFLADNEPGAQVYTAATKKDQAKIVHGEAVRMMEAIQREDSWMKDHVRIYHNNMCVPSTNSKYEPIGGDSTTQDGFNLHGAIIDELHAHKGRELYDKLMTARGSRRQPLIFIITTAGFDRHSICWKVREHAVKVLEGLQDDSFFAYIAALDEGDDWRDESVWGKANPNLEVCVDLDNLREECARAKESPSEENTFRRFHMNEWTEQQTRWLKMDKWDLCAGKPIELDDCVGYDCWAGLDLAQTRDLTALVMAFPLSDGVVALLPIFWIPEETARERERADRVPYTQWIREGWIRATPGNECDYDRVRRDINALADMGINIREIALDRLFQGAQLGQQLAGDGFETFAHGQGFHEMGMPAPTQRFGELVNTAKIRHGGNPVLWWHISNVAIEQDAAGNMKPSRKKSSEKIDGAVAAIMAVGRAVIQPEKKPSVYEKRGILTVG